MKKTKLGISVNLLAALVFFLTFFGGITPTLLLTGYILLKEEDAWLKKTAVKATLITLVFTILTSATFGLVSDVTIIIDYFHHVAEKYAPSNAVLDYLPTALSRILDLIEKIVMLALGFLALAHISPRIPLLDNFLDKHLTAESNQADTEAETPEASAEE